MKNVNINNQTFPIPQNWNEITPAQAKAIAMQAQYPWSDKIQFLLKLFFIFTNLRVRGTRFVKVYNSSNAIKLYSKKTGSFYIQTWKLLFILQNTLSWIVNQKNKNQYYIESKLVNNLFPVLKNKWGKKLYGPDGALFNITWQEFIKAEVLYNRYNNNPDTQTLNQLLAVLYRPHHHQKQHENTNPDNRQPFADHMLNHFSKYTATLRPWQKTYIQLFYQGSRAFLISKYRFAFGSPSANIEYLLESKSILQQFTELSAALTQNNPTQMEKLRQTLLQDVLPVLNNLGREAHRINQKTQNQSP